MEVGREAEARMVAEATASPCSIPRPPLCFATLIVWLLVRLSSIANATSDNATTANATPPALRAAESAATRTLQTSFDAIANSRDPVEQRRLYFELMGAVQSGAISLDSPSDAEALAAFLVKTMESHPNPQLRSDAVTSLTRHPHPVALPALRRALRIETEAAKAANAAAAANAANPANSADSPAITNRRPAKHEQFPDVRLLSALVALRDTTIAPLLAELSRSRSDVHEHTMIGLLTDLGTRSCLEALEAMAADTALAEPLHELASNGAGTVRFRLETGIHCQFPLSDVARGELVDRGFAVVPSDRFQMFELYSDEYPFVTSDVIFHTFMILVRASLQELELLHLKPELEQFCLGMLAASKAQAASASDRRLRELALDNAAFLAVPVCLLSGDSPLVLGFTGGRARAIESELEMIRNHEGVSRSALFGASEDFGLYEPRGRLASEPALHSYAQSILYLGRMTLRLESNKHLPRSLLLAALLAREPELAERWTSLDEVFGLFFGERDDLAFPDVDRAVAVAFDRGASPTSADDFERIALDAARLEQVRRQLELAPRPRINAQVDLAAGGRTRGVLVFGQRHTRGSEALQNLLDRRVWPVSGFDVAATLFDSDLAARRADAIAPRPTVAPLPELPDLPDLRDLPDSTALSAPAPPQRSLAEGFERCFRELFRPPPTEQRFLRHPDWEAKQLNSSLGAWTEVQHATQGYTKNPMVSLGGSLPADRFHGYVEPYPAFYRELAVLSRQLLSRFDEADLWTQVLRSPGGARDKRLPSTFDLRPRREHWVEFLEILDQLSAIAERQISGEGQTVADGYFLRELHWKLTNLSFHRDYAGPESSMALVTEGASHYQTGECLQIAIGRPREIYLAVEDAGSTYVCKGAIYAYHEMVKPMNALWDDVSWRFETRDAGGPQPLLMGEAEMGYHGVLTREELGRLADRREYPNNAQIRGDSPWMPTNYREDLARDIRGAHVAPEDLDLLIVLAAQDTLNLAVRGFVLERLAKFTPESRACRRLEQELALAEERRREPDHVSAVRLYHVLEGCGRCGWRGWAMLQRGRFLAHGWKLGEAYAPSVQRAERQLRTR